MNRVRRLGWLLAGVMMAGWTALWLKNVWVARTQPPLAVYGRAPAFALVDDQQQPVSNEVLRGRVWIAEFFFTRCAGQCPLMNRQMAALTSVFRRREPITFVSFTVDPSHDTPTVLANYRKALGLSDRRWRLVTGSQEDMARICRDGFHLAFAENGADSAEPITHSTRFVLVDPAGQIRGYYDALNADAMAQLTRDARRLLETASNSS